MMKRFLHRTLLPVLMLALLLTAAGCGSGQPTINLFNWGEYMDPDLIEQFEEETGIHINNTTVATCEEMYAKMKNGGVNYDIVIPSDYMVARMIRENMIQKINFDNVPNASYVDDQFLHREYDPESAYSIPYQWGTVGIIYNKTVVDEEDIGSWDLLWNEKYRKQILMFDNSRDAIGIALKRLGKSYNTTDLEDLEAAADLLIEQKPLVQAYVMDQIFDKMESGEAAIAPYYAGDYYLMIDEMGDEDGEILGFYTPEEGSNLFIDAMCIPTSSQNKEAAEQFINFLCEPEIMAQNTEYIWYSTAERAARELLSDELRYNEVMYPPDTIYDLTETYTVLPDEIMKMYDKLWIRIMSHS